MSRKIMFYVKGTNRNIVITDDNLDISDEEIAKKISSQLASTGIGWFETSNDIILGFPGEIAAVHIQKDTNNIFKKDIPIHGDKYSFGEGLSSIAEELEEIEEIEELEEDSVEIEEDGNIEIIEEDDSYEDIEDIIEKKVEKNEQPVIDLSDIDTNSNE